jgi:hypothetical protein
MGYKWCQWASHSDWSATTPAGPRCQAPCHAPPRVSGLAGRHSCLELSWGLQSRASARLRTPFSPMSTPAHAPGSAVLPTRRTEDPDLQHHPANALQAEKAKSYRQPKGETHPGSMAVRLRLANPGAEPWTVAGAVLKDSTGADVELSAWQASAIAPGAFGFVVVGAEGEPGQLACPCSLKLWEAQGAPHRHLREHHVPGEKQAPARE